MKNNILVKTNTLICLVIVVGFLFTAVLSYQANYSASLSNIEQVSSLTSEGIYYQLMSTLTKPVNISLTMANDSLLKEYLTEEQNRLDDEKYVDTIRSYLSAYQKKYEYDSVFLVSAATNRYYNFNGVDRVLTQDNEENVWYYTFLNDTADYSMNVDNDEVENANNDITVFVNCKIKDTHGGVMGVVGVGLRINTLQSLLRSYEDEFGVDAYLIDAEGNIEISTEYTGYQKVGLFTLDGLTEIEDSVLGWKESERAQTVWTMDTTGKAKKDFVVSRYIPELTWHLVIVRDTGALVAELRARLFQTMAVIVFIILIILLVITRVIKGFNKQILNLTNEKQETFRKATEQLYDNIYELNITQNSAAGKSTERYFESLGVPKNTPFDQALHVIAQKQIKEEFRAGYIATFSPENVIREFKKGNTHLRYDFMTSLDGEDYFWMRIDAHIYYWPDDESVHMFVYRKNIDPEKRQEIQMASQVERDDMTQTYHKMATQRHIEQLLSDHPGKLYGFFIFDIDNFKQVNDKCGHAFGDLVIIEFVRTIKQHFQKEDVIGRIGGDEFVVFIPLTEEGHAEEKAKELSMALDKTCASEVQSWHMSASIGVAVAPKDGMDFNTLYKKADTALYQAKEHGKNGYIIYRG